LTGNIEKSFLKEGDLAKINHYTVEPLAADDIFVFTATLCDNDIDRDFEKFTLATLEELAPLFEGKTVIADHSMKSADQRARIFETFTEKQEGKTTADGEALYALKGRAYMLRTEQNAPLIAEIEAGIKKEGSVSCAVAKHTCSVCGRDRRTEGCEHRPSRQYEGKLCYTLLSEAQDAYEFSFVAVPAQKEAGVTKTFTVTEDKDTMELLQTLKSCDNGLQLSQSQAAELSQYIECLEDEAQLGSAYKKELSSKVFTLLKEKLPSVEATLLKSVIAVMTADELLGFQRSLEQREAPTPQLAAKAERSESEHYSEFKI